MMTRPTRQQVETILINGGLAILTIIILTQTLPLDMEIANRYPIELIVYAFLTAFALNAGVILGRTELSSAHVIGMVAFLSLAPEVQPLMLWSIYIGGLAGGVISYVRAYRQPERQRGTAGRVSSIILVVARVVLSFYVAGRVYIASSGPLPLDSRAWDIAAGNFGNTFGPLLLYALLYILLYFAIFLLELYNDNHPIQQIVSKNAGSILIALLLPVPSVVLGAEVAGGANLSLPAFLVLIAGLFLMIIGVNALSRSQSRLQKQLGEMRSLAVVTQAMRSNLDMQSLLNTMCEPVIDLLGADTLVVALYTHERTSLEFPLVIQHGRVANDLSPKYQADGLINHVIKTRSPLLLSEDVVIRAQSLGLQPLPDRVSSWMGAPLLSGDRLLGAMAVTSLDQRRHFTAQDQQLFNIVSINISIALENNQLYQQQRQQLEQLAVLNRISSILTGSLSLDFVLDVVIAAAADIAQADGVTVFVSLNETQAPPGLVRSVGVSEQFSDNPPSPLILSAPDSTDPRPTSPLIIDDPTRDPRATHLQTTMAREDFAAWIEFPLHIDQADIGAMVFYYSSPRLFPDEKIALWRTFATQVAQAIHNARMYQTTDRALERRVEQFYTLAALGRMLTAHMDIKTISDLMLGYATDATKARVGLFALHSENSDDLEIISERGYPENTFADPTVIQQGLSGKVLQNGQPLRISDTRQETGYLPLVPSTRSQLIVPCLRGKERTGVLILESDQVGFFSEEDTHFVNQLLNQTLIALDNTRLFRDIRRNRDRLEVILNNMDEAVILMNDRGQIVLANPGVRLIGLMPKQLIDQPIQDLCQQDDLNLWGRTGFDSPEAMLDLIANINTLSGSSSDVVYTITGEQSLLYIERDIIPILGDRGTPIGLLLIFHNKTQEQELDQQRENISRMIIHDLRSPLTAVTTSMRLLQDLVPEDNEFRPLVEKTTDASQRAIRKLLIRVDSLLDISRMESGELRLETEPTELATLADNVCMELSPLANDLQVTLLSDFPENLPSVNIDADKVERLLLNLVDNALKYSPEKTTIAIRAAAETIGSNTENQVVRVEVIDQGPGIPDDQKENLFGRFVQVAGRQSVRRGVGLGLAFCKMVADAHGGRIWVEDNAGGGSIFVFTLPVIIAKSEQ